jgi:hypothetical protein
MAVKHSFAAIEAEDKVGADVAMLEKVRGWN